MSLPEVAEIPVVEPHKNIISYVKRYMEKLYFRRTLHIKRLEKKHKKLGFLLHSKANTNEIDIDALAYCFLRLPQSIFEVRNVILTPSIEMVIDEIKYDDLVKQKTHARRRISLNTLDRLFMTIQSISDIHDIIPILTAFQIEHNKIHTKLNKKYFETEDDIAQLLGIDKKQMTKLCGLFGGETIPRFKEIARRKKSYQVRLHTTSNNHYDFQAWRWALHIVRRMDDSKMLEPGKDIYVVSSNLHALANLLGGYARNIKKELGNFAKREKIKKPAAKIKIDKEDYRYIILKKYLSDDEHIKFTHKKHHEAKCGIRYLKDFSLEHLDAQAIDLEKIDRKLIDSRLKKIVKKSRAVILNIDYPFGDEAYYACKHLCALLTERIKGAYITGKAGALAGDVGDIIIPEGVYDETSNLTFQIDNQMLHKTSNIKGVPVHKNLNVAAVHGTILSTKESLLKYQKQNIGIVEMESGPFMKALYDHFNEKRTYSSAEIDLTKIPLKIGLIYYVSDVPLNPKKTLGAGPLDEKGFKATYQAAMAILASIYEH